MTWDPWELAEARLLDENMSRTCEVSCCFMLLLQEFADFVGFGALWGCILRLSPRLFISRIYLSRLSSCLLFFPSIPYYFLSPWSLRDRSRKSSSGGKHLPFLEVRVLKTQLRWNIILSYFCGSWVENEPFVWDPLWVKNEHFTRVKQTCWAVAPPCSKQTLKKA